MDIRGHIIIRKTSVWMVYGWQKAMYKGGKPARRWHFAGENAADRRPRRQGRPDQISDVTFEEDGRQDGPWSALSAKAEIDLGPFDFRF